MAEANTPHQGHRDRLKNRFDQDGLQSFEDHNALELLLFYAIPRIDTNEIAHRLITQFGSVSGVFEATKDELMKVKGVGSAAASLIKMIPEYSRLYLDDKSNVGMVMDSMERWGKYLKPKFIGKTKEVTYLICLDSKMKILYSGQIGQGTVNTVNVNVRTIVEIAMRVGAVYLVLSHNHPKGFALPSHQDLITTAKIRDILKPLGIILIDHIVVSSDDYTSIAASGMVRF